MDTGVLERIAAALEAIAVELQNQNSDDILSEEGEEGEEEGASILPFQQPVPVTAVKHQNDEDNEDNKDNEDSEYDEIVIPYAEVYHMFFEYVNKVRDKKGREEAVTEARSLLAKYTGGRPLTEDNIPEDKMVELYEDLRKRGEKYGD